MHTHFALVGGSQVERQAVAEKLFWDHGFIRLSIAKGEDGGLIDRDAWFIEYLPKLEAMALFDTDPVVVDDVLYNDEAQTLRDMGFRIVHCGPSIITQRPEDLSVTVTRRRVAESLH